MRLVTGVPFTMAWAMPNRWTFQIPPVRDFIEAHVQGPVIIDPFSGTSRYATHANDLAHEGVDAEEFCTQLLAQGLRADTILFDPPYSPRQISECYKSIGRPVTREDTQNAALYKRVLTPLIALLKPGGIALRFGWQSAGVNRSWEYLRVLIVQHGAGHSETICVAQRKPELAS